MAFSLAFSFCPAVSLYIVAINRLCCLKLLFQIPKLRLRRTAGGTVMPLVFLTPHKFQQEHGRARLCCYPIAKENSSYLLSHKCDTWFLSQTAWNSRAASWHGKALAGKQFICFLHTFVCATSSLYSAAGTATNFVFLFSWNSYRDLEITLRKFSIMENGNCWEEHG